MEYGSLRFQLDILALRLLLFNDFARQVFKLPVSLSNMTGTEVLVFPLLKFLFACDTSACLECKHN